MNINVSTISANTTNSIKNSFARLTFESMNAERVDVTRDTTIDNLAESMSVFSCKNVVHSGSVLNLNNSTIVGTTSLSINSNNITV